MQHDPIKSNIQSSEGEAATTWDGGVANAPTPAREDQLQEASSSTAGTGDSVQRSEYRAGNEMFTAVRVVLDRRFHWMVVDDVIAVVRGYAGNGLRDSSGEYRPAVLTAVRGVAGRRCDSAMADAVLNAVESVWDSKGKTGRGKLA